MTTDTPAPIPVGGRHRGTHPFPQPYARRHPARRAAAITWPVLLLAVALTALVTAVVVMSLLPHVDTTPSGTGSAPGPHALSVERTPQARKGVQQS